MTLSVSPYKRNSDGSLEWLYDSLVYPNNTLAGIESTRKTFWGSSIAKTLGLSLLTTLESHDLMAEGEQLDQLEVEVETLINNLHLFPRQEQYWTFRLGNVKAAIKVARSVQDGTGGVCIS